MECTLVELLDDNIDSADFIVYTLASKDCAIHHVITIEFYYNFVWKLLHTNSTSHKAFQFQAMIARLPDKSQKCMTVVHRCINVGAYGRVIVIDDLFDGRGAVWSKHIPLIMKEDDIQFYGFNIPPVKLIAFQPVII